MRRPVLLAAVLGALTALLRRKKRAGRTEKDVWTQATAAPDLR